MTAIGRRHAHLVPKQTGCDALEILCRNHRERQRLFSVFGQSTVWPLRLCASGLFALVRHPIPLSMNDQVTWWPPGSVKGYS